MQERKKAMRKALQFEALALIDSKDHAPFVPFPRPLGGRPKGKGEISKWVEGNFVVPWGTVADLSHTLHSVAELTTIFFRHTLND